MLQGGPFPSFMEESSLLKRFGDQEVELNGAEEQLCNGFSRFGLVDVV